MILISACLAGINCKYSGGNNLNPDLRDLVNSGKAVPICPEQLGGLSCYTKNTCRNYKRQQRKY